MGVVPALAIAHHKQIVFFSYSIVFFFKHYFLPGLQWSPHNPLFPAVVRLLQFLLQD